MTAPEAADARQPERDLLDRALRGSVGGRLAAAAASATSTAWASSISRSYLSTIAVAWRAVPSTMRVRLMALTGAIAMIVHFALAPLGPPEPLAAVLPLVVIAACALTAVFAASIARAAERIVR